MSEKRKRDRTVKRNLLYPQYASLKNCNQVNPIAWIAVSDNNDDGLCSVYQIRKLIVVSTEGTPLPPVIDVSMQAALTACHVLTTQVRGHIEENIVRANIGKEEYVLWMDSNHISWDRSIYQNMSPEEVNFISLHTYFKGFVSTGRPNVIAKVKKGAATFLHFQRGEQPIHTWVNFIHDEENTPDYFDNDFDDRPSDQPQLLVPKTLCLTTPRLPLFTDCKAISLYAAQLQTENTYDSDDDATFLQTLAQRFGQR